MNQHTKSAAPAKGENMNVLKKYRIAPDAKFDLKDYDPNDSGLFRDKDAALEDSSMVVAQVETGIRLPIKT